MKAISGHRDVGSTDCPGTVMYRKLPALREEIAALPLLRVYDPVVGPADIDPTSGPLPIRFTARLSSASPWRVSVEDADGAPVAQWTGSGTAVDATWTDPGAGLPDRPALAHRGGHRPRGDRVRSTTFPRRRRSTSSAVHAIASAATGNVTVAYSLTASARISTAITDDTGKLVKVLDAGTRHSRGAQQLTWSGPSGHYRAVRAWPARPASPSSRCRSTSAGASCQSR